MRSQVELLTLIEELCTTEQIKELLAPAKGAEGVRVSASNKHVLVHENLRVALEKEAIGWEAAYSLLNEAEENGDQHIFLFKPSARSSNPFPYNEITEALGFSESKLTQFPNLDLIPNGYVIADLRKWGSTKPHDWVLKIYGDETRDFFTGRIIQEEGGKYLKEFDRRRYRHVILVRWNSPDLLEFRVPRDLSRSRVKAWLERGWHFIGPAISPAHVKDWDLSKARAKLIERENADGSIFRLNDTQVECERHERVTFESYDPQADLFAAQATKNAVRDLLAANGRCTRLNVTWLPNADAPFEQDFRTLVGSDNRNELIIPAHCRSKDVEYVTEQLRKYSK